MITFTAQIAFQKKATNFVMETQFTSPAMKSIGFSNYKRFEDLPSLDLAGITFLVGKNNSGKTSFTEVAQLGAGFVDRIQSEGNFRPVFHFAPRNGQEKQNEGYGFYLHHIPGRHDGKGMEFTLEYDNFLVIIGIKDEYDPFSFLKEEIESWVYDYNPEATIDVDWLQAEYNKKKEEFKHKSPEKFDELLAKSKSGMGEVSHIIYCDKDSRITAALDLEHTKITLAIDDFDESEREELNKLIMILPTLPEDEQEYAQERIDELLSLKDNCLIKRTYTGIHFDLGGSIPAFITVTKAVNAWLEGNNSLGFDTVKGSGTPAELLINDRVQRLESFRDSFNDRLIKRIPSCSRHIGHFVDSSDHNMEVFSKFKSLRIDKHPKLSRMLTKWLKELEIGDGLTVKSEEGSNKSQDNCFIIKHTLINGQRVSYETSYERMGVGSRQLIILLMSMTIVIAEAEDRAIPTLVTIEEPEQNLHPALQSKLADMFLDFYKTFNCQTIIETHSEYLIRRSQVLVAKGIRKGSLSLANNPFRVYYFPDDKRMPYDMGYKENGRFVHRFEPGFNNVAGDSNLELFELDNKQG